MAPVYETELFMLIPSLLGSVPSALLGIAGYVLTALAIYSISRRRELRKPWLAWIPVVNCWLLGSLSDQYRYVVKGENRSKRKWLLWLSIAKLLLTTAIVVLGIAVAGSVLFGGFRKESLLLQRIMGPLIGIAGVSLPMAGITLAYAVIYFMALYDLYQSLDPSNAVLYLVLSVLFPITKPFFLFFNRDRDDGMPPRRQKTVYEEAPQWQPQEPEQEPWEQQNKDYL
ncbi:MAG: hypothetical protein IJN67_07975 [Oscillospiraceae bacterium]|nr:hypothetical protein [Oscillospiraceae bacterium]